MEGRMDEKMDKEVHAQPQAAPPAQVNVNIQQAPHRRRIGKQRSVFAPLLLPLVTFGIYTLVWFYKIYTEADYYCEGRVNVTSGGAVVGLMFVPFFNLVWMIMLAFKTPGLITKMQIADGVPEDQLKHYGHYGWLGFIPLLGGILWVVLVQSAFNQYWERARAAEAA